MLFEALLELIQDKRWEKIRVQDLLDRTGLGRSTFYAHFDNKFDLLTAAIPSITLPIAETGAEMPDLQPLFDHVEAMQPVLRPLLSQPLLSDITDTFHRQLAEAWRGHLEARKIDPQRAALTSQFLAGALMAVCRDWLSDECNRSAGELCHEFTRLAIRVIDSDAAGQTSSGLSGRPILFVLVGLPGSGKTTRAKELERAHDAIRLTPDEWMIPLFSESDAGGKRDILEGRFVAVARQSLRIGTNTVLDFGVWSREERSALRAMAASAGADCRLVYLPIDRAEQRRQLDQRAVSDPETTFEISDAELDSFDGRFVEPRSDELIGTTIDSPPEGFETWEAWTSLRWPSSLM